MPLSTLSPFASAPSEEEGGVPPNLICSSQNSLMSVLPKPTKPSSLNNVAVSDGFENQSATSMASKGYRLCEQPQTRAASNVAPTLQAASAMIASCLDRARSQRR